ncbi:MAG: tetratricopeptide repeat protein, partial [Gemmatimonadetes bacterium]|nr:tetratricopeptide repeat protein [Gemmatimonadota bacterium]NIQ53663.1 tetratricopeptide repeat protein [Gemmatimonadota bacterium]NIU73823.1 tetratricopeptide repeat protein [Gammaproteobacteria bacterium]NIX43928.1 tetratricopeptide repeat protein [Gemmatimonadota bacterium]
MTDDTDEARGSPTADAEGGAADAVEPEPERPDLLEKARARVAASPEDVDARLELARLYRERGDVELALAQLDAALEREPENVELLVERGSALAADSRLLEAERELRKAQRLDPERGRVASQLGIILFKRGLCRQAEV